MKIFKPLECKQCGLRFPDKPTLESHRREHTTNSSKKLVPKNLNINQLRDELEARGLSTKGNKQELRRRLEGALSL